MRKIGIILGIIALTGTELKGQEDKLASQAESYFSSALYDRAAQLYQTLFEKDGQTEWKFKLCQCLFFIGDNNGVVAILSENEPVHDWEIYFLGTALNRLGNFEKASKIFSKKNIPESKYWYDICLQNGIALYHLDKKEEAALLFKKIRGLTAAEIYLARIAVESDQLELAEELLNQLNIDNHNSLFYEAAFLKGIIAYKKNIYIQAISAFSQAASNPQAGWKNEALFYLSHSYLKQAEIESCANLFELAVKTAAEGYRDTHDEKLLLIQGEVLISKGKKLQDPNAFKEAEKTLANQSAFTSLEGKSHALLLRAQAGENHSYRDTLYRQLTAETNKGSPYYGIGWFMRGLNDFEQASEIKTFQPYEAHILYERAAASFEAASKFLEGSEAVDALIKQGLCYLEYETATGYQKAIAIFSKLLHEPHVTHLDNPGQVYYLYALGAAKKEDRSPSSDLRETITLIEKGIKEFPSPETQYLLAVLYYKCHNFEKAEPLFVEIGNAKSLLWAAKCADALAKDSKKYKLMVIERFPNSSEAAEAYFTFYNYQEYLQGDRAAIKHLEGIIKKFPKTPFLINSYYLLGLDYKRDRKSYEGKWIRKRDLNQAIEYFHKAETTFDALNQKKLLEVDLFEHYTLIRYYAILERALTNLAVAEESEGAKRQIFLDYAKEVFLSIIHDFQNPHHPLTASFNRKEPYPQIEEESTFWLGKTYYKSGDLSKAEKVFNEMWEHYRCCNTTKGYFLSRMWHEQGLIAFDRKEYQVALKYFQNADEASKGKILGADEKLDIWIQQSLCYMEMKDYDNAILILTQVTNEDVISSLRLKAMYLRAEAYARQKRTELARNQLKALTLKGGEWAQKAQATLEEKYGL